MLILVTFLKNEFPGKSPTTEISHMVGQFEGFQFDYVWSIYLGGRWVKGVVCNWNFNLQSWHGVIIMMVSDAVTLLVCILQARHQFYMMSAKLQNDLGHLILRLVSEPEQCFKLTVSVCLSSSVCHFHMS